MASLSDDQIRLVHSLGDFQQAMSALTWINELEPDQEMTRIELRRYRCLEDAAVVAYWRPFSVSEGLPKLSLKKLGVKPTVAERALHKELGLHRNKVVAHTDPERMRVGFKVWKVKEDLDLFMPHFVRDDGLALFPRRKEWEYWMRKLIVKLSEVIYDLAQELGETDYVADHIADKPQPE